VYYILCTQYQNRIEFDIIHEYLSRGVEIPACRQAGVYKHMYYVYVLRSMKNKILYKGLTHNLERRLNEHTNGQVQTTKQLLPLELVHVELCKSIKSARKTEKYFKSGSGREILAEVLKLVYKHA
jgi:putative endonuclease